MLTGRDLSCPKCQRFQRFFKILFLVLGIIFLMTSASVKIVRDILRKDCTFETTGIVVDWKEVDTGSAFDEYKHSVMYSPVYEYYYDDVLYRKVSPISISKPGETGKEVTIYLDPLNPDKYYADTKLENSIINLLSIIFGIVGIFLLVAAMLIKLLHQKKSDESLCKFL